MTQNTGFVQGYWTYVWKTVSLLKCHKPILLKLKRATDQRIFQLRLSYSAFWTLHTHIEMGNLKLPRPSFCLRAASCHVPTRCWVDGAPFVWDIYPVGAANIFLQTQILAVLWLPVKVYVTWKMKLGTKNLPVFSKIFPLKWVVTWNWDSYLLTTGFCLWLTPSMLVLR